MENFFYMVMIIFGLLWSVIAVFLIMGAIWIVRLIKGAFTLVFTSSIKLKRN